MFFTEISLWVSLVGFVLSCGIFLRSSQVYNARKRILEKMVEGAERDISEGKTWMWRYDMFDTVSYNQMMLQFWRNPEKMYKDNSFCN